LAFCAESLTAIKPNQQTIQRNVWCGKETYRQEIIGTELDSGVIEKGT